MSMRCPYPGEARITARRHTCSRSRRVTTVSGSGCSSPSCSSARPSSVPGWQSGRTVPVRRARPPHRSRRSSPASSVSRFRRRSRTSTCRVSGPTSFAVPSSEPTGLVVAQHPKAGVATAEGSAVRLNVSTMPSNGGSADLATKPPASLAAGLTVPDVRGQKVNDARKELHRTGLVIDDRRVRIDLPKNSVVSQSPAPGTAARRGDHVLVTVSSGGGKRHGGRHREANEENEDRG